MFLMAHTSKRKPSTVVGFRSDVDLSSVTNPYASRSTNPGYVVPITSRCLYEALTGFNGRVKTVA